MGKGVYVGIVVRVGEAVGVGVGEGVGTGVGVMVGVGTGVAVGCASWTNLTTTVWVAFISVFAVLPDTPKTGPTHSSSFQPCFGRTSIVTVLPER